MSQPTFLSYHDKVSKKSIERKTIGQNKNQLCVQERAFRLTTSHFGPVCKLRKTTPRQNTVKAILYKTFSGNRATKYGLEHKVHAITQFENDFKMEVKEAGLFIHPTENYLAASPDGLIGGTSIMEIKCHSTIAELHPEDGILQEKIKFAKMEIFFLKLNRNNNYYHQAQGNLYQNVSHMLNSFYRSVY